MQVSLFSQGLNQLQAELSFSNHPLLSTFSFILLSCLPSRNPCNTP
jgi:hypothetical protein